MKRPYLKVTPTDDRYDPGAVTTILRGLQQLEAGGDGSLLSRVSPFGGDDPPTFEFVVLTRGESCPVEFYYGVDDEHRSTLETRLRDCYPRSFDIEQVSLDLAKQLVRPIEYEPEAFWQALDDDRLWVSQDQIDETPAEGDGQHPTDSDPTDGRRRDSRGSVPDGGAVPDNVAVDIDLVSDDPVSGTASRTALERPTRTDEGTILARPALSAVRPLGLQWHGVGARKRDWMTTLVSYDEAIASDAGEEGRSPLGPLVDHLSQSSIPLAFQVLFRREPDWSADADIRVDQLRRRRDTRWQRIFDFISESYYEKVDPEDRTRGERERIEQIENTTPKRSFAVNLRAVTVQSDPDQDDDPVDLTRMQTLFSELNGQYYELTPRRFRAGGVVPKRTETRARRAFRRFQERTLQTGDGRDRPDSILTPAELANFVAVPAGADLTVEATRQAEVEETKRNPLARPTPRQLQPFRETGMACGYVLDDVGQPESDPIRLTRYLLSHHYARIAATGGGKSVSIINDLLSLHATVPGPQILIAPKGDGMGSEYLQAHFARFGDLDDVLYFRVPEQLPAISFFDIRPDLANGRDRSVAIQDRVEHFREVARMVLGADQYDQAFVADQILGNLITALFDAEYGQDAFGLDDLASAARQMQRSQSIPPVATDNVHVESKLTRHFEKDQRSFHRTMDAVHNRIDVLQNRTHLSRMLDHVPEWDRSRAVYTDPTLDLRTIVDRDVTVIVDLGGVRDETQRAMTLVLLSSLWQALQSRKRPHLTNAGTGTHPDPMVNVILEEAAPIVSSKLVYEHLLPESRSFGLSMGLVLQYPEQVRTASERAYQELLNNVHTKFVGNVAVDDNLAESLAYEDLSPRDVRDRLRRLPPGEWLADLGAPEFRETGPAPFSLAPLEIPAGHSESDQPLQGYADGQFQQAVIDALDRVQAEYGLGD